MPGWPHLSGLFGPRWRHPDPATRRRAVMELTPEQPDYRDALAALVEDAAPPVREAAIKRCSDLATLRAVRQHDPDASVRTAAAVRHRQRLIGDEAPEQVAAELARCDDPTLTAHVAQQGRTPALRRAAIDALAQQPRVLTEVALHDDDAETRLYAVSRLHDPEALERLCEHARHLDPEVAEAAERRRRGGTAAPPAPETAPAEAAPTAEGPPQGGAAEGPPQDGTAEAPAAGEDPAPTPASGTAEGAPHPQAEALCHAMEALADGGWWPGLHARRRALMAAWRGLSPEPPEALASRFREATKAALIQQPRSHGGDDATRACRDLEGLLAEAHAADGDPAATVGQRLEALTRSLGELNGDHIDEARARTHLQRLGRLVPQLRPLRPASAHQWPAPRPATAALARAVAAAEAAIGAGALDQARQHLAEARRLLAPAGRAGREDGTAEGEER